MTTLIIAVDSPDRPSKSVQIAGPEEGVDTNRATFFSIKEAKWNPTGLAWVQLWSSERGVIETAHTPSQPPKKGTK